MFVEVDTFGVFTFLFPFSLANLDLKMEATGEEIGFVIFNLLGLPEEIGLPEEDLASKLS